MDLLGVMFTASTKIPVWNFLVPYITHIQAYRRAGEQVEKEIGRYKSVGEI